MFEIPAVRIAILVFLCCWSKNAIAADAWADQVISYTQGVDPSLGYVNPSAALGHPTVESTAFGGYVISAFSPAAGTDEVVSLGNGGQLTVKFDEPVLDDPGNPFGIDLLVFGNSLFTTGGDFDTTTAKVQGVDSEGGAVYVSSDGVKFLEVPGAVADGLLPTNGYADTTVLFPTASGMQQSDYTRPVNPNFDPMGLSAADLVVGYGGSAGGAGIDIGALGLSAISYVRITNDSASLTPEIDGFADVRAVPEPSSSLLVTLAGLGMLRMRRRDG